MILAAYYIFAQTQIRPVFITASVLGLGGLLLILVGFVAELIVSQSEQIRELELDIRNLQPERTTDKAG